MGEESLILYIHNGETYLGMEKITQENTIIVRSPVKVTFSYENTGSTSARLTWLLTPVLPSILIPDTTKKPHLTYNKNDILKVQYSGDSGLVDFGSNDILPAVITAYKSITGE